LTRLWRGNHSIIVSGCRSRCDNDTGKGYQSRGNPEFTGFIQFFTFFHLNISPRIFILSLQNLLYEEKDQNATILTTQVLKKGLANHHQSL
jgi:hypothetical protein